MRQLLLTLGEPVIGVVAAPAGLDVSIENVVIVDPDDEPAPCPGALVLIIGLRGRRALRLIRTAARQGAAAVAVKIDHTDDLDDFKRVAAETGVAALGVRPEVRWGQLDSVARGVVDDVRVATVPDPGQSTELFALAETVAALTDGIVSIEDSTNRVLAYSRSDDEVDELRRRSILGWQGPAEYLDLLRQWGVLERLRAGDDVVHIDEHPQRGIRRRLAIGIRVDSQLLGSIWVQEGRHKLADKADTALIGAARAAALHLVRRRTGTTTDLQLEQNLLSRMLDGHIDPRTFADDIGADLTKPAVVTAFTLNGRLPDTDGGAEAEAGSDRPRFELRRSMMTGLISVHAAAYRRRALVTDGSPRFYMLLPGLPEHSAESIALGLAGDIVRAAHQRLNLDVRAAVGSAVGGLDSIAESRAEADCVLDILTSGGDRNVATIADVRSEVLVRQTLSLLEKNPHLRDPRISCLVGYDAEHGTDLVPAVLSYLGAQGNVRAAARSLHIHTNTLRYRLRRANTISGIDLADPHQGLFSHLQLLLESGSVPAAHGH